MEKYLSYFDSHFFIMATAPTSTATPLTGELTAVNSKSGGEVQVNVKENYHIDGDGFASKTPISKNISDIEINYDRAASAVYNPAGETTYDVLRNWEENFGATHKYFVEVVRRNVDDSSGTATYEGTYYDVINAGRTEGDATPDDIQSITQRFGVSGGKKRCVITKSDDSTFSWKTA